MKEKLLLLLFIFAFNNILAQKPNEFTDSVIYKNGKIIVGNIRVAFLPAKHYKFPIKHDGTKTKFHIKEITRVVNDGEVYFPLPVKPEKKNEPQELMELLNVYKDYKVYLRHRVDGNVNHTYTLYVYKNDQFEGYLKKKNSASYIPLLFGNCEAILVFLREEGKLNEEDISEKYKKHCRNNKPINP